MMGGNFGDGIGQAFMTGVVVTVLAGILVGCLGGVFLAKGCEHVRGYEVTVEKKP